MRVQNQARGFSTAGDGLSARGGWVGASFPECLHPCSASPCPHHQFAPSLWHQHDGSHRRPQQGLSDACMGHLLHCPNSSVPMCYCQGKKRRALLSKPLPLGISEHIRVQMELPAQSRLLWDSTGTTISTKLSLFGGLAPLSVQAGASRGGDDGKASRGGIRR